jgi:hypothetical protein
MSMKVQLEELQRQILELQQALPDTPFQQELQRLQRELISLQDRPPINRPRISIVAPKAPEMVLSPTEKVVWKSFAQFHTALLQYAGDVGRDQWVHLIAVASQLTAAAYSPVVAGLVIEEVVGEKTA